MQTDEFHIPTYHPPKLTTARLTEIGRVARMFAERNRSDPFAYARIALHMRRGIIDPADVIAAGPANS